MARLTALLSLWLLLALAAPATSVPEQHNAVDDEVKETETLAQPVVASRDGNISETDDSEARVDRAPATRNVCTDSGVCEASVADTDADVNAHANVANANADAAGAIANAHANVAGAIANANDSAHNNANAHANAYAHNNAYANADKEKQENTANHADLPAQTQTVRSHPTFGRYPNPLNLTDDDRSRFHRIMRFPVLPSRTVPVLDLQDISDGIAPQDDRRRAAERSTGKTPWHRRLLRRFQSVRKIGLYDENRISLYSTDLFQDPDNHVDGYAGVRTVHLGIDLMAPVGTPVHAFADGVVHSAGYNSPIGDYGHVLVVEHSVDRHRKVWALYGHLSSEDLVTGSGTVVRKGQILGRVGDVHENGGWVAPHLHFQVSVLPPETHDMPGAYSLQDRPRALAQYFDPRYIVGPIYR